MTLLRILLAALLLARVASADPNTAAPAKAPAPVVGAATPEEPPAAEVERAKPERKRFGKLAAALTTGAIYSVFGTYAYFAWFRGAERKPFWFDTSFTDENPFGIHTYAGGADKFGHLWSNYALTRGTTELLMKGGWPRLASSLVAAGLDLAWFTASEVKDGFIWGFEAGDEVANVTGAALGILMENVPAIDRLVDFRLEYVPSSVYLHLAAQAPTMRNGGLDIGQDYTGQSYTLALHLGALPRVGDSPAMYWARYADLVAGFETRHYSPPESDMRFPAYQNFYLGLTFNMQAVLTALFRDSAARTVGRGAFEVYTLPYTTVRFAEDRRYDSVAPPPQ